MTFPLALDDLTGLKLGQGKIGTGTVPLGESPFTAELTVGADSPLQLGDARLEITPVVVGIKAEEIATRRKEREDATRGGTAGQVGAGAGAVVGGLAGALGGPVAWWGLGGPKGGADKGAKLGGELGEAAAATTIEQKFSAEIEQAAIKAHFPLVYNPYVELRLGMIGANIVADMPVRLQTGLELDLAPFLSLDRGTKAELYFKDGRFTRGSFAVTFTGGLNVTLNAMAQLSAALTLIPSVGGEKGEDRGIVKIELFRTPIFDLIRDAALSFEASTSVQLATGSDLAARGQKMKTTSKKGLDAVLTDGKNLKTAGEELDRRRKGAGKETKPGPPGADGWHRGTEKDPVPIVYYKPVEMYPQELTVRDGLKVWRIPIWPHQRHQNPFSDLTQAPFLMAGLANVNVPKAGKRLKRTKSGSRTEADRWKVNAEACGIELHGLQVDHVWDLGLGGRDAANNLWPISKANNQAAARMYQQTVKWWPKEDDRPPNIGFNLGSIPEDADVHLIVEGEPRMP